MGGAADRVRRFIAPGSRRAGPGQRVLAALFAIAMSAPLSAQATPPLTGSVVDQVTGGPVGTVSVPAGLEVRDVGSDHLPGVRTSELDVPFIERYRIVKPQ